MTVMRAVLLDLAFGFTIRAQSVQSSSEVSNENAGQQDHGNPNPSDAGQPTAVINADFPPTQPSDGAVVDAANPVLSGELGFRL
jgi:hypothetical protein